MFLNYKVNYFYKKITFKNQIGNILSVIKVKRLIGLQDNKIGVMFFRSF